MKISKDTLKIITNMSSVNDTIVFKEGHKQGVRSTSGSVVMVCDIAEYIPTKFGIFETNRLLKSIDLFEDPEIEFKETQLTIKGDFNTLEYGYCDKSLLKDYVEVNGITKTEEVLTFKLDIKTLDKVKKAASIFKSKNFVVNAANGVLTVCTGLESKGKTIALKVGETDQEFNVSMNIDDLCLIDDIEYEIVLYRTVNPKTNSKVHYLYIVPNSYSIEYAFVCDRTSESN